MEDVGARAAPAVVVETLRQLGLLSGAQAEALADHARPLVRNYRGEIVGEGRPMFQLSRA
ncbi:MAG: hypothetical protein GEU73_00640 [Chloroflexi bacterium]|nr:hypothetical protein [Chloroflexota bacterium]